MHQYLATSVPQRSAGWSWRLELEWCERKTLLSGWSWRQELE